jgi:hypothetical protein
VVRWPIVEQVARVTAPGLVRTNSRPATWARTRRR